VIARGVERIGAIDRRRWLRRRPRQEITGLSLAAVIAWVELSVAPWLWRRVKAA
jgi:hypothetical protein